MERFRVQVLRGSDEIARIVEPWRALCDRAPGARLEHDPAWVLAEARAAAADGDGGELVLAALHRGGNSGTSAPPRGDAGDLVGIAPLLVRDGAFSCDAGYMTLARFPVRLGTLLAPLPLVSEEPGAEEAMADAVGAVLSACDLVLVESMPSRSRFAARLLGEAGADRDRPFWVHRAAPGAAHRIIRMPESFEAYLSKFKGRTRKQLAYRRRRLEAAAQAEGGALSIERIDRPEQVPSFLERAGEVSRRGWKGTRLGKVVRAETHGERLLAYARAGWLRSYLMSLAGRPVAFAIGWQARGTYHYEHPAYDPDLAAQSPGNVLLYSMLEDLFAHDRPEVFDFGRGDNEYKRLFSNEAYDEAHLFLVRKSLYTGVAMVAHGAVASLAQVAKDALEKTELRGRVRHFLRRRPGASPERAEPPAEAA